MFPWPVNALLKCQVESVPAEMARITGLDYKTARKLSNGEPISTQTLERCPFPDEIIRWYTEEDAQVGILEEWETTLVIWQKVFIQSGAEAAASFANLKTTFSAILWIERFFKDTILAHRGDPQRIFGELLSDDSPLGPFPNIAEKVINAPNTDEQKLRVCCEVYEITAFSLYYAAIDHDFRTTGLIKVYVSPRRFLPTWNGKSMRRPMWHFFDWLRDTCDCKSWKELTQQADPLQQDHSLSDRLKNWRNTKTQKTLPRRESVESLLASLSRNNPELAEDFSVVAITAYGFARVMQAHVIQCTLAARIVRLDKERIPESYAEDFLRWEKTGCREVPLHPMFDSTHPA